MVGGGRVIGAVVLAFVGVHASAGFRFGISKLSFIRGGAP